jgi:hypothetical protein
MVYTKTVMPIKQKPPTTVKKPVASPYGTSTIHGNVSRDLNKTDDRTKAWEMKYLDNFKKGISSSNKATADILNAKYGIQDKPAFDQETYLKNMTDQVNGMYDKQKEARMAQFKSHRDKAVGQINQQKSELAPQYAGMRNQTDVVNAQNVSRLRELMASQGLSGSGENVTSQVALGSARQGALNQLNTQEQQQRNDFDRRISDLNNPAEEQAMEAALESERMRMLYDASIRADDVGYSRGRDTVMDGRYADETRYNRGRDTVMDNRYTDERDYSRGRDKRQDFESDRNYNRGVYESNRGYNRGVLESDRAHNTDEKWRNKEWSQMSPAEKERIALDFSYSQKGKDGRGGGGGGGGYYAPSGGTQQQVVDKNYQPTPEEWNMYWNAYSNEQKRAFPGSIFPNVGSKANENKQERIYRYTF